MEACGRSFVGRLICIYLFIYPPTTSCVGIPTESTDRGSHTDLVGWIWCTIQSVVSRSIIRQHTDPRHELSFERQAICVGQLIEALGLGMTNRVP